MQKPSDPRAEGHKKQGRSADCAGSGKSDVPVATSSESHRGTALQSRNLLEDPIPHRGSRVTQCGKHSKTQMRGLRVDASVAGPRLARSLINASPTSGWSGVTYGFIRLPRSSISAIFLLGRSGSKLAQRPGLAVPQILARPRSALISTQLTW